MSRWGGDRSVSRRERSDARNQFFITCSNGLGGLANRRLGLRKCRKSFTLVFVPPLEDASDAMVHTLSGVDRQTTNLSQGASRCSECGCVLPGFGNDSRLEDQSHPHLTLWSVLSCGKRDDLLGDFEGLDAGKVDSADTQTFGLLDLVPIEDFHLEVGRNAGRLTQRDQNIGPVLK